MSNLGITLDQAIEKTAQASLGTRDITDSIGSWAPEVGEGNQIVLRHKPTDRTYRLTPHAMTQLCLKSGLMTTLPKLLEPKTNVKGEVLYERTKSDADLVRGLFAHHLWNADRFDQEKPYLIRTNNDDGTIRAVLSERYSVVNNVWFLEQIQKHLGGREVQATRWRGDADTLYGELIFPDEVQKLNDSDYFPGLTIGNSEIGIRRVSLESFVYRLICTNGMIGRDTIANKRWKHLGAPKLDDISGWVESIMSVGHSHTLDMIEGMQKMLDIAIPESAMGGVFTQLGTTLKLRQEEQKGAWQYLDHERAVIDDKANSLFGIHSAYTRYAQTLDNESWSKMELTASELVKYDKPRIDRLIANAHNVDVEFLAV